MFKHNFQVLSQARQQIDELSARVAELPAYKMRRSSPPLKAPHDLSPILADYADVSRGARFRKGELCRIEESSSAIKWRAVSVESKRDALVPSVLFILRGPEPELVELVDRLRLKHDRIREDVNKLDFLIKKDKISQIMAGILESTTSPTTAPSGTTKSGGSRVQQGVEAIVNNVREEIEAIISSTQTISSSFKQVGGGLRSSTSGGCNDAQCSSLINEFKEFDKILKQIVSSSSDSAESSETSKVFINKQSDHMNLDELEKKLNKLSDGLARIVCATPAIEQSVSHALATNNALQLKFQVSFLFLFSLVKGEFFFLFLVSINFYSAPKPNK